MTLNLKFLRVQSGMTLEQLATDSGLTRSYLSKLERGLSSPSIGSALKIAEALGTSLDRLYGQRTTKILSRSSEQRTESPEMRTHTFRWWPAWLPIG